MPPGLQGSQWVWKCGGEAVAVLSAVALEATTINAATAPPPTNLHANGKFHGLANTALQAGG